MAWDRTALGLIGSGGLLLVREARPVIAAVALLIALGCVALGRARGRRLGRARGGTVPVAGGSVTLLGGLVVVLGLAVLVGTLLI